MKRLIYIFAAAMLLFAMAFMTACGVSYENGDEKYDVVVRVKNSLGDTFIFDLDTDTLYCEYPYTGEDIEFWVNAYNLPNHSRWSEEWFGPSQSHDWISRDCLFWDTNGVQDKKNTQYRDANEKGEYHYGFRASGTLFKYRVCYLFVTIY